MNINDVTLFAYLLAGNLIITWSNGGIIFDGGIKRRITSLRHLLNYD